METYKAIDRTNKTDSNKGLLNKGFVPGIVYGKGSQPSKIAFEIKVLKKLMDSGTFYSTILDIDIDGKVEKILPKQLQYHPVTDRLIHFDFLRVREDTKVTVEVTVDFLNQETCPGLKKGGVLNLVRRLVELNCNANNIPSKLEFDLANYEIGDAVKISNIKLPDGVKPTITDRDFVIATIVPPTVEVETKTEETEGEATEESEGEKESDKPEDKKEDTKEAPKENSKEESKK